MRCDITDLQPWTVELQSTFNASYVGITQANIRLCCVHADKPIDLELRGLGFLRDFQS